MTVTEIKKQLQKKATGFRTGGFKPTNAINESWIGRVYLYKKEEEIPLDEAGNPMLPLLQLSLDGLPFVPDVVKGTKVITVFISKELPMDITPNGKNWLIREYAETNDLEIKDLSHSTSPIKPFPLSPYLIKEDFPVWEDVPFELVDTIEELEESGAIEDYYDLGECAEEHKLGGYPCFCQNGIYFGDGYEFVLQISSDDKARLNIVDSGSIYLAKNRETGEWVYYCDFF